MCMGFFLPACMSMHTCAWDPQRLKEGAGSPGTGAVGGFEPPYGYCKLNLGPLQEE